MILGYLVSIDIKFVLFLFVSMLERIVVIWNEMICGFVKIGVIIMVKELFDKVLDEMRIVVIWIVMVDGYVSNGDMEVVKEVFEEMLERNYFVWFVMIFGYCK